MADYTALEPRVPVQVAYGQNTRTDTTAAVTFLTIPAGMTFVGQVNVTANSRATTAAYGQARCAVAGVGGNVPDGTAIIVAGSSRDAGACPVTMNVVVSAPAANSVDLQLANTTATTFNSSACAFGEFV
jgi:hypothetical protein